MMRVIVDGAECTPWSATRQGQGGKRERERGREERRARTGIPLFLFYSGT